MPFCESVYSASWSSIFRIRAHLFVRPCRRPVGLAVGLRELPVIPDISTSNVSVTEVAALSQSKQIK